MSGSTAHLQELRGDSGGVLEQLGGVLEEHGLEVGVVSRDLMGGGLAIILGILGNWLAVFNPMLTVMSGHLW